MRLREDLFLVRLAGELLPILPTSSQIWLLLGPIPLPSPLALRVEQTECRCGNAPDHRTKMLDLLRMERDPSSNLSNSGNPATRSMLRCRWFTGTRDLAATLVLHFGLTEVQGLTESVGSVVRILLRSCPLRPLRETPCSGQARSYLLCRLSADTKSSSTISWIRQTSSLSAGKESSSVVVGRNLLSRSMSALSSANRIFNEMIKETSSPQRSLRYAIV